MNARGTAIAVLFVVEIAIIAEAGLSLRGGWHAHAAGIHSASGSRLVEGGPHKVFAVGDHPDLTVDIGYADLTIVTNAVPQIDVAVAPSNDFGMFRATEPIAATEDGETVRVETGAGRGWSSGDDRMVTIAVPPQTRVTVVKAGNIKAEGLRAQASFNSVGRDSTMNLSDYDADALNVAVDRGRIVLRQVDTAHLDATVSEGAIEATGLRVRDGSVESDGRVMLGFAAGSDTLVTAETANGRVNLAGFDAALAGEHLPLQTVRIGAGKGHLNVHASDGNITLAQES